MAVLDPHELFEQAELLTLPRRPGPPRQVDVRRAISASYYGVFHFICTEVADHFVGRRCRQEARYSRVYRSIDHATLGTVCRSLQGMKVDPTFAAMAPAGGFSSSVRSFAAGVTELKAQRHKADYDPSGLFRATDARLAISIARRTVTAYLFFLPDEITTFLTLLAFKGR